MDCVGGYGDLVEEVFFGVFGGQVEEGRAAVGAGVSGRFAEAR